jgi:hypothetical protein
LETQSGKWFAMPLIIIFVGDVAKLRLQIRCFTKVRSLAYKITRRVWEIYGLAPRVNL